MKQKFETDDQKLYKMPFSNDNSMPHINFSNQNNFVNGDPNINYKNIQEKSTPSYDNIFPCDYYKEQNVQPIYVNSKQLICIQKRKARREYLDTLMAEHKNNYLHESRHRHAMQRKRAPTGRFLTKAESQKLNQGDNELGNSI